MHRAIPVVLVAVVAVTAACLGGGPSGPATEGAGEPPRPDEPPGPTDTGGADGGARDGGGDGVDDGEPAGSAADAGAASGDGEAATAGAAAEAVYPPRTADRPDLRRYPPRSRREVVRRGNETLVYPAYPLTREEVTARLDRREKRQRDPERVAVEHDLGFRDVRERAGITFQHDAIPTSTRIPPGAHFFHYPGLAAADVEGDGDQDLYFLDHRGRNELWLNDGDARFTMATDAGVGVPGQVSAGAAFGDHDGDGDPDLYVTTLGGRNHLFENRGDGSFSEVTARAGVADEGYSSAALWLDHDGDGDLDLYVVNLADFTSGHRGPEGYPLVTHRAKGHWRDWAEASTLYENVDDGFLPRASAVSLPESWNHDAMLVPEPGEPPGLYVMNLAGDDRLVENTDEGFVPRTETLGRTPFGTMGGAVLDRNGDGGFDLFVSDKHSDMMGLYTPSPAAMREKVPRDRFGGGMVERRWGYPANASTMTGFDDNIYGNALYRRGRDGYREVSDTVGAETFAPWGVSTGDVNADGRVDAFLTSGMNHRIYVPDVLLLNGRDGFAHAEYLSGLAPREGSRFTEWSTVDCDDPANAAWCRTDGDAPGLSGTVTVMARRSSRGSVLVDLDRDGDLDVVTNEFNARPRVLENRLSDGTGHHYLSLELRGTRAPRDGVGATVAVELADGRTLHRFVDGKSGFLSQSQTPLYVGLGDASEVASVTVTWPTGDVDGYAVPAVDARYVLRQDGSARRRHG